MSPLSRPSSPPIAGGTIGERIDAARKKAGLTKSELAREMGKGYRTIQTWIRDEHEPGGDNVRLLAEVLGVTADELLGIMDGQAPPFVAWVAFLETPTGKALPAEHRKALAALPWPRGTQPTVAAYIMATEALRLTMPR